MNSKNHSPSVPRTARCTIALGLRPSSVPKGYSFDYSPNNHEVTVYYCKFGNVITLTKIKMLLQYCRNIAATRFCCQKDPQEKCSLLPVAAIVLALFTTIMLEAILLPETLPELGHPQWSFLFNFLFSNLEGNDANKENNFH